MQERPPQSLPDVTLAALAGILAKPHADRLIDLRPLPAFEEAHLPGASRLALDELDRPYLRPPRRRRLILMAESVEQAREGARRLVLAGYTASALDAPVSLWPGPFKSGPEEAPPWEPSPLVGRWAGDLPPGRAVDLACGSGRDAVYMAMRGIAVTAIDVLPDALDQAALLAKRHAVAIDLRLGDIERDPSCWDGAWGTIHVHRFLHRPGLGLMPERLREGGLLLYETFLERQLEIGRKPRNPAHLLQPGELLGAATGLQVIDYHEGQNEDGDWTAALAARKETGS